MLLGNEAMDRIAQKRVIIFGVGGVGSWCAESLVRSGIRQLTIVDSDRVCITNSNRQLMATTKTVGQVKVDALKERLLSINPKAEITALQQIFSEETAESFELDTYDYIIDAIDSLKDKAALILLACKTKAKFFSSMGAALKLDPTRIKVTEFWKVQGDPLARALRLLARTVEAVHVGRGASHVGHRAPKLRMLREPPHLGLDGLRAAANHATSLMHGYSAESAVAVAAPVRRHGETHRV